MRILFSAFRTDQYADAEGYVASLKMVLEGYPDDVIVHVTDPRTGVQRGCKWPPTIAEIVSACDARLQELVKLAGRQRKVVPLIEGPPREERPTLAELKAKYGETWGLMPPPAAPVPKWKAPSWQSIVSMYQAEPGRITRLVRLADEIAVPEEYVSNRVFDGTRPLSEEHVAKLRANYYRTHQEEPSS